jgi:hypothetical protein
MVMSEQRKRGIDTLPLNPNLRPSAHSFRKCSESLYLMQTYCGLARLKLNSGGEFTNHVNSLKAKCLCSNGYLGSRIQQLLMRWGPNDRRIRTD